MKKDIWKFVAAIAIVVISLLVIDIVIGRVLDTKFDKMPNNGGIGKTRYTMRDMNADIVVVGSSRAEFHYNSNIISDTFNLSTYNIGQSGSNFNKHVCFINSVTDRYTPKLIVLEVEPFDLYDNEDPSMRDLYIYYKENDFIKHQLQESDGMVSQAYGRINMLRYNNLVLSLLLGGKLSEDHMIQADRLHGYVPLPVVKHTIPLVKVPERIFEKNVNPRNLEKIEYIFNKTKAAGTKMVVVVSPYYYDQSAGKEKTYAVWDSMCRQHDVLFIDNSELPQFSDRPECFKDADHLNSAGADKYTKFFVGQLKELLEQ